MAPIPKPAFSAPSEPATIVQAPPRPERPVFPLSALGPALSAAATAVAARTQAPLELIAHHLLTLAAMPAQRLISLRLPTGSFQPVSSYFLSIVGSGEGRSAAEKMCVEPVRFWERRFTGENAGKDGRRRAPVSIHLDTVDFVALLPVPDAGPQSAAKPFEHDHVFLSPFRSGINDRYDRYARFGRRSGLFAGTAADLLTPSCARRNEADSLSALWDGRVVVTGDEGASLAPRLSVHLVATPGEGLALLRAPELLDSGLAGRMLAVQPASRIGTRSFTETDGAPPPELQALHILLTGLYAREATTETRIIGLDAEAKEAWLAFAAENEAAIAPGGAYADIRSLAGHLAEHAARLAAIVALVEDGGLHEIGGAALALGIELARFYAAEALRLQEIHLPAVEDDFVMKLEAWLEREKAGQEISLRDIYRAGPPPIRSRAVALRAMRQVEELGLAERARGKSHGNAGPRWRIAAPGESVA